MNFTGLRIPDKGFTSTSPKLTLDPNMLITGSKNLIYGDDGELQSNGGWKLTNYGGLSSNRGGDLSFLVGKGWAVVGNQLNEGSGNIVEFIGRSLWFTGTGEITVFQPGITSTPQALGNSALQNNIPQVAVLNTGKTGYQPPLQIGLLEELGSPSLVARTTIGSGFQGIMNGTYSVMLTFIRDATGGESLPTPPSNSIVAAAQTLLLIPPTSSTNTPQPRDRWRVYATGSQFGQTGPYLFFTEIPYRRLNVQLDGTGFQIQDSGGSNFNLFSANSVTPGGGFFSSEDIGKRIVSGGASCLNTGTRVVTGVTTNTFVVKGVTYGDKLLFSPPCGGTGTFNADGWTVDPYIDGFEQAIEIEWQDTDLSAIQPPTDFFPPATTAQFIVALVNVMVLIGTEDGLGVASSVPNFPEAYPPNFRLQLPEPPVGVLSRPDDGFFYIVCLNSIHEVRWTGAVDGAPVTIRTVANQVGAIQQTAMCQAGADIYLFDKSHKPVRILSSGVIDQSFGDRVSKETKSWTAGKISISYDTRRNAILYAYQDRELLYYPVFDVWTAPQFFADTETNGRPDGTVNSLFTKDGIIHESHYTTETPSVSISATTNTVTTASFTFTHRHLGKVISIPGAGAGPSTLVATITNIGSPTSVSIDQVATNTVGPVTAGLVGFDMWTFDRDLDDGELQFSTSWIARFSFSDYDVGKRPKTVTKVKVGADTTAGTYDLKFFRNYNTSVQVGDNRSFTGASGDHVQPVIDCNNGESELLSSQISGTGVRDKLYFMEVIGDASGINTNFGV